MNDCSNCGNSIEVTPTAHVCNMEGKKYVISNYPSQGENCSALKPVATNSVGVKGKSKDPLVNFFNRRKQPDDAEKRIIEAFDRNMNVPTTTKHYNVESSDQEVNVRSALGWILAAVLGGALIGSWLLFGVL